MSLKEDLREWNDYKKRMREKMVVCPACGLNDGYKTHKGRNCWRCATPLDKEGNIIFRKS